MNNIYQKKAKIQHINILLIEDNPGDAKLVEIYLKDATSIHFQLKHAVRLSEGIQIAQQNPDFDIVLLDLSLPDSRGFQTLTKAMKAFPKEMSIVVLTGLDDESLGMRAVEMGAQDYLVKGQIDTSSLTRSVLHAIQRQRMQIQVEETARNLRTSEDRLIQAQNIACIGNYELEINTNQMYWSQQVFRIFGIHEEIEAPNFDDYLDQMPYNDKIEILKVREDIIDNDLKEFSFEHRVTATDTYAIKYVRNQGQVEFDEKTQQIKFIGTIQDITEYKTAQEMLMQSRERYRTVFEESQDAIYITTIDGEFVEQNGSLLKMLGYTEEEFEGISEQDLYANLADREAFIKKITTTTSVKDFDVKMKKKNNEIIDCLLSSTLWKDIDGSIRGYHGIIRDITTIKKTQELIRAKEVAEQTARLREQFLANMSHEIRTPMNVVVGMTHLLENTPLNSKQQEYLNALALSSDTLLKLINSILDFSKIESGKLELEHRLFKLQDLIKNLIHTYKYKTSEKGIKLFTQLDVDLPSEVIGDSVRLQQILNNLLSNAIKYTDKGRITLGCDVVENNLDYVNISFWVEDSGIGIPIKKQKHIFESFTQASENTTRLYGGTGLGLSIAKELVELFGGKISVESEEGRGSTFKFNVKFNKNIESFPENRESQSIYIDKPATKSIKGNLNESTEIYKPQNIPSRDALLTQRESDEPIRILLVEDNEFNQLVAHDLLKRWSPNLHLDITNNGKEAVDKLEEIEQLYDVILMDISMPIMDGYVTTKYIRQKMSPPVSKTPIIAMTAHAFTSNAEKCFQIGMNAFVSKPIRPQILYAQLNKILDLEAKKKKAKEQEQLAARKDVSEEKPAKVGKITDLSYLDSLTGGSEALKITMLEALVKNLPGEISQVKTDFEAKKWESLKQSAHKMKSNCAYIGLEECSKIAATIENRAWQQKELYSLKPLVEKLVADCNIGCEELKQALQKLKSKDVQATESVFGNTNGFRSGKITKPYAPQPIEKPKPKVPEAKVLPKLIDLSYLDSLTGGNTSIKLTMLETLVRDLPKEIAQVEMDFNRYDWEGLKQSAHKIKSTCSYIGLTKMTENAKNIENNAWERKNLNNLAPLIKELASTCRDAHQELINEFNQLKK
ncbi:MAG: response regulator [Chitinophagales bacterium]